MPAVPAQGVFGAIAAALKQPVVTLAFGVITVVAGYTVTATTTKSNTAAIEELKARQTQLEKDALTRDEFYRESLLIRDDIKQVRDAQIESNKHFNDYIMRKDVRSAAH